jgi:hypothetical protein
LSQLVREFRIYNESHVALVEYDSGYLMADTLDIVAGSATSRVHVTETRFDVGGSWDRIQALVNFSDAWDPDEVSSSLKDFRMQIDDSVLAVTPIPPVPEKYSAVYKPYIYALHLISRDIYNPIEVTKNRLDKEAGLVFVVIVFVGLFGVFVSLGMVWWTSRMLTRPLLVMDRISWRIVNHAHNTVVDLEDCQSDGTANDKHVGTHLCAFRCFPRTEIDELVSEFRLMVKGFSGPGPPRIRAPPSPEIRNSLTWRSGYDSLFARRAQDSKVNDARGFPPAELSRIFHDGNVVTAGGRKALPKKSIDARRISDRISGSINRLHVPNGLRKYQTPSAPIRASRSKLFRRVLCVLVAIVVFCMSSVYYKDLVDEWRSLIEKEFVDTERESISHKTRSHASVFQAILGAASRDLYILTRVAGWLTYGGISRSESFTVAEQITEACKVGLNDSRCLTAKKLYKSPCPCAVRSWAEDSDTCIDSLGFTARQQQRRFYAGQARDADLVTGRRTEALSFKEGKYDFSPESTLWWNDTSTMPGSIRGRNASGFATTYDRVRVMSAVAAVEIPIYNHAIRLGRPSLDGTTFVAFDPDGLMTGFSGCEYFEATVPFFNSTDDNKAASIAPDLCPEGKFGLDPRCFKWYSRAKKLYHEGNTTSYVAPRFRDDLSTSSDSSVLLLSQPLVNPSTGDFAGQVAMHISVEALLLAFLPAVNLTLFVVSIETDVFGGDTVVVPPKFDSWKPIPLADALYNDTYAFDKNMFNASILPAVKRGETGQEMISWTTAEGATDTLTVAFAPIRLLSLAAVNPSRFERGTSASQQLVCSVGTARLESDLIQLFEERELKVVEKLRLQSFTVVGVAFVLFIIYVVFICYVSVLARD